MQFFTLRQKVIVMFMTTLLSAFAFSAAARAATTVTNGSNVNAAPATTGGSINAALNGPVGEAAAAAALTAESPELQAAVKSVWRLAFDAFWNFIKKAAVGFVGLFTSSVSVTPVDTNVNAAVNGNVNAASNVNSSAE